MLAGQTGPGVAELLPVRTDREMYSDCTTEPLALTLGQYAHRAGEQSSLPSPSCVSVASPSLLGPCMEVDPAPSGAWWRWPQLYSVCGREEALLLDIL